MRRSLASRRSGFGPSSFPPRTRLRQSAGTPPAFGVEPYFDEPFYVGFNIGGYELGLSPSAEQPVTYWRVDDPQNALDELVAKGATVTEPVTDVGDGIIVATVRDPFGQLIGLIRNPHFKGGS